MKSLFVFLSLTTFFLVTDINAQVKWEFDAAHSNLQFSLTHLMVSDVEGSVQVKEATLLSTGDDFNNASISIVGDMSTIDTDNEGRDNHLKSADFFEVAKYPNLTFTSTTFQKTSNNKYSVTGLLTMHGVSKQITLEAVATTNVRSYDNKSIVGFRVNGTINRVDFNIGKDTPGAMLSEEVQIKANAIFVKM